MPGNRLRVLRDARENYPAWLRQSSRRGGTIHSKCHIVHDDATGTLPRGAGGQGKAGVTVRILYDWFGSLRLVGRGLGTAPGGGQRRPGGKPAGPR